MVSESGHESENETERKRETGTEASRLEVATLPALADGLTVCGYSASIDLTVLSL